MSISNNNNTGNHNSLLQMLPPQSPVEENKKWRCTKLSKGGNELLTVSPELKFSEDGILRRLSENEEISPKTCTTKISSTHPRICRTVFVRLAEESPKTNSAEYSDSSTYDSLNCHETDICHDSSDTDSNSSCSSDPIGTIKVVEYEVASASNSEDLFTNDSSSGTEDMFIAVTSVLCKSSGLSSDFADTEEGSSDTGSMYDAEMSSADYWMCVKCKNKNNNPMFRYCEKCYQIRKTHFPPRPRLRKSRSALKQRKLIGLSSLQRAATTSLIEESLQRRRQSGSEEKELRHNSLSSPSSSLLRKEPLYSIGRLVGISQKQLRHSAESSTDDDDTTSKFYKCMNNTSSVNNIKGRQSSSHSPSLNGQKSPQNQQTCTKRKLSTGSQTGNKSISKKICYNKDLNSPLLASETENETDFALSQTLCGGSTQGTQKDSGFSSAPSSQERKSSSDQANDEYEDCISQPIIRDDASDTVSDELNDSDVSEMLLHETVDEDTCLPVQKSHKGISNSLPSPMLSSNPAFPLLQTISDCSDTYSSIASPSTQESLKISSAKQAEKLDSNFGDITSYGSCMTCLTEPKNGVFVHSRFLHLCCCYKCAMKIWNKSKKCPICNCTVKNVMKLFVH